VLHRLCSNRAVVRDGLISLRPSLRTRAEPTAGCVRYVESPDVLTRAWISWPP